MPRAATNADIFHAVAEPRRREIIGLLNDGREWAVNDVVARIRIAQPAVSKHLGVLRRVGVVTVVKRGQRRLYRLHAEPLKPIHDWIKVYERYWDHQISRIRNEPNRRRWIPSRVKIHPSDTGEQMPVTLTEQVVHSLEIVKEEEIAAPIAVVFETILEQMGPPNEAPGTGPMPMKLEAWPGGRWYRDLGDGAGHFWGAVQSIKPPVLLEICGPLFMSYPAVSNVQYRLSEENGITRLKFTHRAMAQISHDARIEEGWARIEGGWGNLIDRILAAVRSHTLKSGGKQ